MNVKANSGEIWLPSKVSGNQFKPIELNVEEKAPEAAPAEKVVEIVKPAKEEEPQKAFEVKQNKAFEEMTVEELQEAILEKMRRNGPVTDQMKKDVFENVYHDSLVTWVKSFN